MWKGCRVSLQVGWLTLVIIVGFMFTNYVLVKILEELIKLNKGK